MSNKIFKVKIADNGRSRGYLFGIKIFSFKGEFNFAKQSQEIPAPVCIPEPEPQPMPPKRAFGSGGASAFADNYLLKLRGLEIGGASYNQFYLNALNVDYSDDGFFQEEQLRLGNNEILKVDIVAEGDNLPFKEGVWDFVFSSHVLEHFWDPIKALKEWMRVIKPGGYIFMIVPHKERTFDKERERTPLKELIDRHNGIGSDPKHRGHYSVWITEDVLELCKYLEYNVVGYMDVDDKVGNGFSVVLRKTP